MKENSKSIQNKRETNKCTDQTYVLICTGFAMLLFIVITVIINNYIMSNNQMIFMLDYEKFNYNFKSDIRSCINKEGVDEIELYSIIDTYKSSYKYGVTVINCEKKVHDFLTAKVKITLSEKFSILEMTSNLDGKRNGDYERILKEKIVWISSCIAFVLTLIIVKAMRKKTQNPKPIPKDVVKATKKKQKRSKKETKKQ